MCTSAECQVGPSRDFLSCFEEACTLVAVYGVGGQDLAAVVNANSHGAGAANGSNTDRALGVFPALSMLNHACAPNCVFACAGARLLPCCARCLLNLRQ